MLGRETLLLRISLMFRDLGGTCVSVSLFTMEKRLANSDLMQVGFLNCAFHLLSAMSMTYIFHIFIYLAKIIVFSSKYILINSIIVINIEYLSISLLDWSLKYESRLKNAFLLPIKRNTSFSNFFGVKHDISLNRCTFFYREQLK